MLGRPRFSVVIAASRPSSLGAAIRSVLHQTLEDWELIVVGQGDDAAVHEAFLRSEAPRSQAVYLHIAERGLSRARNAGVNAARADLVAMMDDDCEAAPDWLAGLRWRFEDDPGLDFIGGAMVAPPKPPGSKAGRCPHWIPQEILYDAGGAARHRPQGFAFVGGNFAFRRTLAQRVGPFDELLGVGSTFPAGEDTDYLFRMEASGARMLVTPRSVVRHSDGWRYGRLTILRHQRGRGLGNGALAAKRTMSGDPGGRAELRHLLQRLVTPVLRLRRPEGLWYVPHFWLGYWRCLRRYRVDERGLLQPRLSLSA